MPKLVVEYMPTGKVWKSADIDELTMDQVESVITEAMAGRLTRLVIDLEDDRKMCLPTEVVINCSFIVE